MSYIKTKYSRGIVALLSTLPTLSNPEQGETAFCSENGRVMTYDGQLWMCDDFIKLTNISGRTVDAGEIMVFASTSSTTPNQADVTTNLGNLLVAGVVMYSSTNNSVVALAYKGIYNINIQVFTVTPVRMGYVVRCGSTAGGGKGNLTNDAGTSSGWFAWTVEVPASVGLVKCLIRNKVEYN
jgi:hypothetical protein